MAYAKTTKVSVDRSLEEIKKVLRKANVNGIACVERSSIIMIMFEHHSIGVKMFLHFPQPPSDSANKAAVKAYEQICRSKARSLLLCIKAKIEAVESNIETFEQAFLPHIVLKNGDLVGNRVIPALEQFNEKPTSLLLGL